MRILQTIALAGLVGGAALGQDASSAIVNSASGGGAAPLAFEVATIKPAAPLTALGSGGKFMIRMGVSNDGQMVNYNRMSIRSLVRTAYGVKDYQVEGAPWMDTLQFDISAKMPEGATKDQAPEMLKTLLKERFKLSLHREQREHAVFALVVSKGGPKLTESKEDPDLGKELKGTDAKTDELIKKALSDAGAKGGSLNLSGGAVTTFRMSSAGGGSHMTLKAISMRDFADQISRYVSRPVINETAIEGKYDFSLDLSADDMANARSSTMPGALSIAMGAAMAANGGRAPAAPPSDSPAAAPEGSIYQSIQSYGLKLEPKKAPMDTVVIDSAEKSATEN